jgi:tRNA(fMet)-specific endonuclease VapC
MKYLLDSNIIINYLKSGKEISAEMILEGACINSIIFAEIYYGIQKSQKQKHSYKEFTDMLDELLIEVIDIDERVAMQQVNDKIYLEQKGEQLSDDDLFIAATAKTYGLILVTENKKHFTRIPELELY